MKKFVAITSVSLVMACAVSNGIDTSSLSEATELHQNNFQASNGRAFDARAYIIPFKAPYYVLVTAKDGNIVAKDEAEKVAVEFIRDDACKGDYTRQPELDKTSEDQTSYLIGISC